MSDTVGVTHVGLWQRILLFFCPPKTVQANCFDQPWVGVTEEWCGRVSARFEQQERRAAAIAMLEKEAAKLRGEGPMTRLADGLPASSELLEIGPTGEPIALATCPHAHRVAEHVQYCCDCQTILVRDERAMIPPLELQGLQYVNSQMNEIALWMRLNFTAEIERGEHAGKTDAQVIIGYLSRLKVPV